MSNEREEPFFENAEQAMDALLTEASTVVTDAARAYLLGWAQCGLEREGMMTRREVLLMIGDCVKYKGDAYLNAQAMALANVLGAHDQWEIGLQEEVAEAVAAHRRGPKLREGLPARVRAEAERRGPLPADFRGSWPGGETDEEIEQGLRDLHGEREEEGNDQ